MPVMCVRADDWVPGGVEEAGRWVVEGGAVPRVAVETGRLWADGMGIRAERAAECLCRVLEEAGAKGLRVGVAKTPVAAWAAAATASETGPRIVEEGMDRAFLVPLPLEILEPDRMLRTLLEGVGIETCGQLAEIAKEAVDVRFGGEQAVRIWRLARADDYRRLFPPIPPERPHASLDFVDYVITNPEQLLFTANALIGGLCANLAGRGEHVRAMRLDLPLANGERWSRVLRPARPTASRSAWLRLARSVLERLTVPDAVTGVELRVESMEAASAVQGDLFDAGFATANAVDAALARLLETQGPVLVRPEPGAHPLPERGVGFEPVELSTLAGTTASTGDDARTTHIGDAPPGLTLQLLSQPRPVLVETVGRRDHTIPIRYRDGRWKQLATVAGPDRISGGAWEAAYAREYFRGVTAEGTLVLLFHDARAASWYLHGWWD